MRTAPAPAGPPPRGARAAPAAHGLAAADQHAHRAAAAVPARARVGARRLRAAALAQPGRGRSSYRADHPTPRAGARRAVAVRRVRLALVLRDLPAAVRQPRRLPRPADPAARPGAAHAARRRCPARSPRLPASDRWETDAAAGRRRSPPPGRAAPAAAGAPSAARRRCRPRRATCARPATCVFHVSLVGLLVGIAARQPVRLQGHRARQGGRRLRQHRPVLRRRQPGPAVQPGAAGAVRLHAAGLPARRTPRTARRSPSTPRSTGRRQPGAPAAAVRRAGQPPAGRRRREGLPDRPRLRARASS